MSRFIASPTMRDFMMSDKYVRLLAGSIGSGKSVCCAHELMRWAATQAPNAEGIRKTRFLITRNTADQLKSTTYKTIVDWFPPEVYGRWAASDKTLFYNLRLPDKTIIQTEWMLIALDTPDDVRKALSLEATGLWGNEARELHPEVVDGLLMRVNRYPSMKDGGATRPGAIFDTNYPNEDTWWESQMLEPPRNWSVHEQPEAVITLEQYTEKYRKDPPEAGTFVSGQGITYAVDPAHDNYDNLAKDYYPNTGEGKTEDFIRVYLRCQFGRALGGKPIYEHTFNPDRHIKRGLQAIRSENHPLCIGLDFGRQPAAVVMQLTTTGQVLVLGEVVGENMGMQKFMLTKFTPYIAQKFPGFAWYLAPDPAGFQMTQLGEQSPAGWLKAQGHHLVRPPTNDIGPRVEAVETLLMGGIDTYPMFLIDDVEAPLTAQGLKGKYRWKTDKNGVIQGTREPVKNKWSHPGEALQYGAMVITGGHQGRRMQRSARPVKVPKAAGWT